MSSGATRPARAPASIDMLQTVIRSSIESARIAEPQYSNTQPVPPPMPIREIRFRMMSFAVTPVAQLALDQHLIGLRLALQQALRRQHVLDFAGADAERERAESAMRRGVAVAADYRHAGLREAAFRSDDVNDALLLAMEAVAGNAELFAVRFELRHLRRRDLIDDRQRARRGRNAVIHGRDRQVRSADLQTALAQAGKRLRAKSPRAPGADRCTCSAGAPGCSETTCESQSFSMIVRGLLIETPYIAATNCFPDLVL